MNEKSAYETIFSAATLGIIVVDSAGQILNANPFAAKMFGYSTEELISQTIELLVPLERKSAHRNHRHNYFLDPKPRLMGEGMELFGLRKNGKKFPVEISLNHSEIDSTPVTIAFINDVTEREVKDQQLSALETTLEQAAFPVALTGMDRRITYVNQAFLNIVGWDSKEEIIGHTPFDFSSSKINVEEILSSIQTRGSWQGEDVAKRKDGSHFHVYINAGLIRDKHGNPIQMMATFLDISQLKEQEAAIKKEKETARTYLDMAGSIILVADRLGVVSLINQEGSRILGYSEDKIVGTKWLEELIHPEDREKMRQVVGGIFEEDLDQYKYIESKVICKYNREKLIRWDIRSLKDEKGQAYATISSGVDITQARAIENQLKESRAKLKDYSNQLELEVRKQTQELAFNQSRSKEAQKVAKLGYWEWTLGTNEVYWSEQLYNNFGLKPGADISLDKFFDFVHPEDKEDLMAITEEVNRTGVPIPSYYRIITPKGEIRHLYGTGSVKVFDEKGTVVKLRGIIQDVTELRETQEKLEQALNKERELGDLKSRFVSMASHEFRTPLTSILASAELIEMYRQRNNVEKQKKHIARVKSNVKNLTTILDDFLSLEKLESGKIQFNPSEVEISEFVSEVIEEMNLMTQEKQQIKFQHTGNKIVRIDPHLVKNILLNLLSNAIKYSTNGNDVHLHSSVHEDQLIIQVQDHGIGIPLNEQEQLFSRFFRASNATNIKGTGLGLIIVKRYLDLMKGNISFTSKHNEGTTFEVTIPQ